jgi:ComF family protein
MTKRLLQLKKWFQHGTSLSHLLFPESCLICADELRESDKKICTFCASDLLRTDFEKYSEPTNLDRLFWGRVSLTATFALLYFEKGKSTQKILHALKYRSNPQVGEEFGKEIGRTIKKMPAFADLDALLPVPIHPKKAFVRGYNQSEELAKGIGIVHSIPVDTGFLKKLSHTASQTKKGKFARWDNVADNFGVRKKISYQHIALVDDVVTTGATLEALIRSIQKNYPDLRISILSLAITKQ